MCPLPSVPVIKKILQPQHSCCQWLSEMLSMGICRGWSLMEATVFLPFFSSSCVSGLHHPKFSPGGWVSSTRRPQCVCGSLRMFFRLVFFFFFWGDGKHKAFPKWGEGREWGGRLAGGDDALELRPSWRNNTHRVGWWRRLSIESPLPPQSVQCCLDQIASFLRLMPLTEPVPQMSFQFS